MHFLSFCIHIKNIILSTLHLLTRNALSRGEGVKVNFSLTVADKNFHRPLTALGTYCNSFVKDVSAKHVLKSNFMKMSE